MWLLDMMYVTTRYDVIARTLFMMQLTLCTYIYCNCFLIIRALYINKISCLLSQGQIVTPVLTNFDCTVVPQSVVHEFIVFDSFLLRTHEYVSYVL